MNPSPVEPVETQPLLRIVKGNPTPDEVAALVAVVSAMANAAAQAAQDEKKKPRPEWSARHRLVRTTHRHGPGAWRASAR